MSESKACVNAGLAFETHVWTRSSACSHLVFLFENFKVANRDSNHRLL